MIDGYKYEKNFKYINGLFNYYLDIRENLSFEVSGLIKVRKQGDFFIVDFYIFIFGCVVVVKQVIIFYYKIIMYFK